MNRQNEPASLQYRIMGLVDDDVKISEARSICRAVTSLEQQLQESLQLLSRTPKLKETPDAH